MYEKSPMPPGPSLVLAAVATAQLIAALDMSVVAIALPGIRDDLGFSAASLAWVVNGYALAFGGLLLLGGRLGDVLGRRTVFLSALALFAVASVAGGFATSPAALVAARATQGVAAAGLVPASLAILTTTFPEGPGRTRALAVWMIVGVSGAAVGMIVGGLLVEYASWRWVLWINVPIVAVALVLGTRSIPRDDGPTVPRGRPRLDVAGAVLGTAGVGALVLGVIRTDAVGWGSSTTLATLAAAVVLLVAFVVVEARVATQPLVRIGLLLRRGPGVANLVVMLVCSAQFAALFFVSIQVQRVMGYAPALTGVVFVPFCAGMVAGSAAVLRLLPRLGPRPLLVGGAALGALGLLWFSRIDADSTFLGSVLGPMVVMSVGLALCFVPATSLATSGVAPSEAGMAAGIHNAARQIGGSFGLAVLVTIATAHEQTLSAGGMDPVDALGHGQARGLAIGAAVILAAGGVALLAAPRTP